MTDLAMPDPIALRILSETGDVKEAITRLTSQLHWTKDEAEQELQRCLASGGVRDEQKAKRRSVPRAG